MTNGPSEERAILHATFLAGCFVIRHLFRFGDELRKRFKDITRFISSSPDEITKYTPRGNFYIVSDSFTVSENYRSYDFRAAENKPLLWGILYAILVIWLVCYLASIDLEARHAGLYLP